MVRKFKTELKFQIIWGHIPTSLPLECTGCSWASADWVHGGDIYFELCLDPNSSSIFLVNVHTEYILSSLLDHFHMLFSTSTSSTGQHTVSNFPHWFRFSGRDLCMFLPVCCSRNRHYNGTVIENHLSVEKMGVIIGQSLHLSCYGVWLLPLSLVGPQLKSWCKQRSGVNKNWQRSFEKVVRKS